MYRPYSPSRPEKRRRVNGSKAVPSGTLQLRQDWGADVLRDDEEHEQGEQSLPWNSLPEGTHISQYTHHRQNLPWAQTNSQSGHPMGTAATQNIAPIHGQADIPPVTNHLLFAGQEEAQRREFQSTMSSQLRSRISYQDDDRAQYTRGSVQPLGPGRKHPTTALTSSNLHIGASPYGESPLPLPSLPNAQAAAAAGNESHLLDTLFFGYEHGSNSMADSLPNLRNLLPPTPAAKSAVLIRPHARQSAASASGTKNTGEAPQGNSWRGRVSQGASVPSGLKASAPRQNLRNRGATASAPNLLPSSAVGAQTLRLGQITPVRDALSSLEERSAAIIALRKLIESGCSQPNAPNISTGRQQVLGFSGFNPAFSRPDPVILTALAKADLDNLAWAFGLQRNGRKADIARRIIQYLTAPITWATPVKRRTPSSIQSNTVPGRFNVVSSQLRHVNNANALNEGVSKSTRNAQLDNSTAARSTTTATSRHGTQRNQALYDFLKSQISAGQSSVSNPESNHGSIVHDDATRESRELASVRPNGASVSRGLSTYDAALDKFDFMEPENPFHIPIGRPLGNVKYVLFTADQLSRGYEPVLLFHVASPPPVLDPGEDLQVHLRCLRVEAELSPNHWKQYWPFPASARVNGNAVTLGQAQRYTNGKLAGTDTATNISPFVRKFRPCSSETNKVVLRRNASTTSPSTGSYVLFVQRVRVKSCEVVKRQVLAQSESYWKEHFERHCSKLTPKGESKAGDLEVCDKSSIFELAKHGVVRFMNSDELSSSSMKVSLRCPLMLTRISTPVKGRRCSHVQCFDLDFFLLYARRSAKFLCPVCNNANAKPDDLVVSPYIQKALELFTCDEVEISADGSLSSVAHERTGVRSEGDDSDDDDDAPNQSSTPEFKTREDGPVQLYTQGSGVGSRLGRPASAPVVDLTLSDGEDAGDGDGDRHSSFNAGEVPGSRVELSTSGKNASDACSGTFSEAPGAAVVGHDLSSVISFHGPPGSIRALCDELVGPDTNLAWSCDVIALDSD
jgi:MIZ/SP-RING zinc finger